MAEYTRLTNLEVTGTMKLSGLTKTNYAVTSPNAAAAADSASTKAEFDAVVTLVNELKTDYNKLVSQLSSGSDS